nr:PREDICTED: probable JmjC domain-containing histone demethylation protein 2C isoform X3 [Latimeria chalumnae]|eukprot:XP_014344947.1 PREDICTED: probable JmjC domain-containing histone demethylation protein 2C isoform X3 [Latimeria chalumnae]
MEVDETSICTQHKTFKPLIGKCMLNSVTAVEFFVDRQLDFVTEESAFQPYQDEVDSLSPVLRDNPQLQEEVKAWVKEQKVQEIFMQGPYSLNGYRVRVYRQDSATQWFTGIITHHDLFSRTMVVMNDQVLEPQNVDPSMVQMTFLDDVVHSLLKGENIGITSRRRSRSNQTNNTAHGHYTRAQANSPRPAMNSQTVTPKQNQLPQQQQQQQQQRNVRSHKRKGSDSSVPDEDKTKEEKVDNMGRGEFSKTKNKQIVKRRKPEEEEKKVDLKRPKEENALDCYESSDSENSNKKLIDSSSEQNSENELKNMSASKSCEQEGESQCSEGAEETTLIDRHSPWDEIQEDEKACKAERFQSADSEVEEKPPLQPVGSPALHDQNISTLGVQGCIAETKTVELLPKEHSVCVSPTSESGGDEKSLSEMAQENNNFSVQAAQKLEFYGNDLKQSVETPGGSDKRDTEFGQHLDSSVISKTDSVHSEVMKTVSVVNESPAWTDQEKLHYGSVMPTVGAISSEEGVKKLHKSTPSPDILKPKANTSPVITKSKSGTCPDTHKHKLSTSPDTLKPKANYQSSQAVSFTRAVSKIECELPRSSFHSVTARLRATDVTKSPLIIDKNEHFTVYRDPTLVGPEPEANHVSAYLHQHVHPLHASTHATCITPNTHHPTLSAPIAAINAHLLSSASHHHHPHLLQAVLPGVPPASLIGGHSRLDSTHASNLSHLAQAHHQQQQLLQHQSPHLLGQTHAAASYNQLGLYPIIWQYPNGTHPYPRLSLPSSKWVHPENSMNTEASLRRNTPSPWLHQPTPVSSADSLGLLSHIPVRPASTDLPRPLKLAMHSSPPLSKAAVDHHKEEMEKKSFVEPLRSITPVPVKSDLDHSRSHIGKESHLHRHFMDPGPSHNKKQRPLLETGDRQNKYKEENRRILQESIEVAPFTAKIKATEGGKDPYSRIVALPIISPKGQVLKQEKDVERSVEDLFKLKHALQTLPQSNYFTTLSNSVVNEPPQSYPSKEAANLYGEKHSGNPSMVSSPQSVTSFNSKSLSKPPPLIKHQSEGEGLVGKITEQLSQQVASHTVNSNNIDCRNSTQLSVSPLNPLRSMPALHRAPVFHPPIQQNLERKESNYGSLSPPMLTPVQPVNAAGKLAESQKPPTLIPELKDINSTYKINHEMISLEIHKGSDTVSHEKSEWHLEKRNGKPQAATASVIVRPPSSMKYDSVPVTQSASKDPVSERLLTETNHMDCLKTTEARETGSVILPNINSISTCTPYGKHFQAFSQGNFPSSVIAAASIMCSIKTEVTTSATTTTSVLSQGGSDVTYSVLASPRQESATPRTVLHSAAQSQECKVSTTATTDFLPINTKTGTTAQAISGGSKITDFIHLKKHKAALAAAQSRSTNSNENEPATAKVQKCSGIISHDSTAVSSTTNKANSVSNGQSAQLTQPNYHTKLKKAWLTRHSEEDKNTNKVEKIESTVSEIIKPCSVNLIASTSNEVENSKILEEKAVKEDKITKKGTKRTFESGSESDDSDESESKSEQRAKRQPKPTYKKKQNDLQKKRSDAEKEEEEIRPNGILSRSAKEKSKLKLQNSNTSNGIPRSVLKDWRKVKRLKQTGESFLQDDSCSEIGPNLQKCRECRMVRNKKAEEPTHSPVFCRFYYFRRLSFSKNGVVRIDGFSSPDQYDEEALSLWTPDDSEENELDMDTCKYILDNIGDKFCQLVMSEKTAMSWVKKDAKIAWKRAVRGVREMCDACEATLFNIHWVCQKCGFVACLDCYKAKERKSSRDKELYAWMKCVKGQPHDHKHLMPTQIIPGSVLTDLVEAMHTLREKFGIKSHCLCSNKPSIQCGKLPVTNGVSQVLQNVLNHSNKISLCLPESQQSATQKPEMNGSVSPGSNKSTDSKLTPPESQSPLHWLADLAEQKSREEKKENKGSSLDKQMEERDQADRTESLSCKASPPVSHSCEQGSTLRDLLTTTAGKLRLGSTDAGIAFAPVYSSGNSACKGGRNMPNILDDIIASVVENKIPAKQMPKLNLKVDQKEETKNCKKSALDEYNKLHSDIPHSWLCDKRLLWLKDHKNRRNMNIFRDCWRRGLPVLVSGVHKKMNSNLWKAELISQEFGDQQADLLDCKDGIISNANIKEFWDGFEDITKRPKVKSGETVVLKLKDWPSGEDFRVMMPSRYDDFMKMLPLPEYSNPEGNLNLASYLPGFFVRPDLGPRMCSAYGVAAAKDQETGTTNLHVEVSDILNILVYVGVARGNGVLSKTGVFKKLEEEDLDDLIKRRLKDSSETPGALWHIFDSKDIEKIHELLQKVAKEQGLDVPPEHDPIRDQSWYLNKKLRERLLEEYGVKTLTVVQFLGDAVILPAGTLHQVQNLHSCIQVIEEFVSPEHLVESFHLTQELRPSKDEINYDDKLQVKNILYHSVKEAVGALKVHEEEMENTEEN